MHLYFLVDVYKRQKNDQWELIKTPEKLDYIFDQKHNVKQMLEDYTSNRIIPSQRDSFRKFADINTLMTRLEPVSYTHLYIAASDNYIPCIHWNYLSFRKCLR